MFDVLATIPAIAQRMPASKRAREVFASDPISASSSRAHHNASLKRVGERAVSTRHR